MQHVAIRAIQPGRWAEYKELRLYALTTEPAAFGRSYEEEIEMTRTEWQHRMKNVLFAEHGGALVGMVVYAFETNVKSRHAAHIFGMYVRKEYRRHGIGRALMEEALSAVGSNPEAVKVTPTVNPSQRDAVRLYERLGFAKVGTLHRELKVDDSFDDMLVMELLL